MNYKDVTPDIALLAKHYDYKQPPDLIIRAQELFDKIWRFVVDWLASLKILVPGFTDTNVLANFLQVAVILVAVVALFFTAYFLWKRVSTIASDMNAPSKSVGEIHSKLDSNGWKEAASRFSESSQWKDACRALYMSALMLLDERSILKFVSTRTNYEYTYVLMSQSKQLAESFRALANIVELVWFGNKIAEANDYNACALALKQIDVVVSHLSRSEVNSSSGSLGDGKYSKPEPHANV